MEHGTVTMGGYASASDTAGRGKLYDKRFHYGQMDTCDTFMVVISCYIFVKSNKVSQLDLSGK